MKRLSETKVRKLSKDHFTKIEEESVVFGEGHFTVIAGPCALESEELAVNTAKAVEHSGAKVFRCSLFKPRTSPYTYQGYGIDGVNLLKLLHSETNLLLETEVLSTDHLDTLAVEADILRIGSRNMDNYELLKAVGKINKPVILKRNMSATLEEFLLAAEYILSVGNDKVILCERGIRTFETYTRNTLDILAVPALKELTHLPVIVDPSHSTGKSSLVPAASKAALAAGADGLMIEVHPNPIASYSDGQQSLDIPSFEKLMKELSEMANLLGKKSSISVYS
ncbi:MAG: 3-deoxy-7-phosphoheptulonate synthase [Ignavibacteriota bacterium]|nr:MAG: 3-deoxy-7-phosphoheptulonate synthase [Chlorobiota bacterium]MBE7477734.1 3-deoxy-7-phosphoheptulonate synthase [Ignavibacteriales bacterium]MBL1123843.1 3-deoxy-7-phosphoheptulonate synthase [Ignavibacteriota bacterium]MCC7095292.1 3-deoxy-7-phosphoheptulonate synthase [Ignavibacteriaceae bacterium]MCE7855049.1 3-deoxy-7-phosphoheptulonate synthase [Ignavibacteria bacterium CHB3]MEB2295734.1 3-deoxy-7-phosphoheptulonate synthase [Ignavibacteria bacterium]